MESFEQYVGQIFDNRYRIDKVLGIGGMAVVFQAQDTVMDRTVAVKMLKESNGDDAAAIKRFVNESKAVSMLSHANIVKIYDVSVKDKLKYIVMEYIDGITLKNYISRKGVLPVREVISFAGQILAALAHAHQKGIIHRDIKPQNIMLLKNGVVKVTDFGIAKLPSADTVSVGDKAIGTVYYISPEQASGKPISPRSDLYSLGIMMYEMATGTLPFVAESPVSVAMMQISDKPVAPKEVNESLPVGLEQIILRAMEKDPQNRYENAMQMLIDLSELRKNPGMMFKTRPRSEMALVGAAAKAKLEGDAISAMAKSNNRHKKSKNSMLITIGAVVCALLLVAIISIVIIASGLIKSNNSTKTHQIEVKNVVGVNLNETDLSTLLSSSIYQVKYEYVFDENAKDGVIVAQSPAAGSAKKVKENSQYCVLTLSVSRGENIVYMPDYTASENREVKLKLEQMGLALKVKIERQQNKSISSGYVISTSPAAGDMLTEGQTVVLYVSSGSAAEMITMPDLSGLSETEAMKTITDLGLTLGNVTFDDSSKDRGTVLSQSIKEGDSVPKNVTVIDITVSNGEVDVPSSSESSYESSSQWPDMSNFSRRIF
ncbi:MAG: Stk1 family PASTA domain-containing Ser/Thr kinase [Clostridia bacterium]|nr:Stk1 family PASTA domain-containing Ser/Thr kinase [Clostridia bacterium]